MPTLIFVYGTLMRGHDHPMARRLADHADWMGAATCRGWLYRISSYPGLVPSSDAADVVHGDLFELPNDDGRLLAALDDYEGCGLNDPQPHPYARTMIDVSSAHGETARAWAYIYTLPVTGLVQILMGRFRPL